VWLAVAVVHLLLLILLEVEAVAQVDYLAQLDML
jgi:hypothetical protein